MSKQNMDEINAYCMISKRLVGLLAEGKRDIARNHITQILLLWHNSKQGGVAHGMSDSAAVTARMTAQQVRSFRFIAALDVITAAPESVERPQLDYHFGDMEDDALLLGFDGSPTEGTLIFGATSIPYCLAYSVIDLMITVLIIAIQKETLTILLYLHSIASIH